MTCRRHQRAGFLDGGRRIGLVAEPLGELLLGRGEFRERIDKAADHHRRHVLYHIDEDRPVENQVHGAAHARIVERLSLVVDPGRVDHALVVIGRGRHPGRVALALRAVTGSVART